MAKRQTRSSAWKETQAILRPTQPIRTIALEQANRRPRAFRNGLVVEQSTAEQKFTAMVLGWRGYAVLKEQ